MKSMTGFGRASGSLPDGSAVSVLVRSVNHRFLDLSLKLREELAALEQPIRRLVGERVARGHVDLIVRIARAEGRTATLDGETASRYAMLWREAAERYGLPRELTARDLLGLPGVLATGGDPGDPDDATREALFTVVVFALDEHEKTRRTEGGALKSALLAILTRLDLSVERLNAERDGLPGRLLAALAERMRKLVEGRSLDDDRLLQEAAMAADRADIVEEIDRLRAHLAEFRARLEERGAVGKRLDFLTQELLREVNTAGSKAREIGLTSAVLEMKSDVEALKEQVQNVE